MITRLKVLSLLQFLSFLVVPWRCLCGMIHTADQPTCGCSKTRTQAMEHWVREESNSYLSWTCGQIEVHNANTNQCGLVYNYEDEMEVEEGGGSAKYTANQALGTAVIIDSSINCCTATGCGRSRVESTIRHVDTLAWLLLEATARRTGMNSGTLSQMAKDTFAELNGCHSYEEVLKGVAPNKAHPIAVMELGKWSAIVSELLLGENKVTVSVDPDEMHRPLPVMKGRSILEECRVKFSLVYPRDTKKHS